MAFLFTDSTLTNKLFTDGTFADALTTGTGTTPTTTTLSASPSGPITAGVSVTFTATVTPGGATGTVIFLDSGSSIGTGAVAAGQAQLLTSALPVGVHSITATYNGDTTFDVSASSPPLSFVVNAGASGHVPPGLTLPLGLHAIWLLSLLSSMGFGYDS